ncbi:MAG: uracil-DNA glycosylase [Candidatus Omnitrophica bacterium]|nr:uracil-DNA glycosylase [Candidatus Omnitrophota bacterium]MCM8790555.1 uracil-DNA glycosylase [Candidatus Omnitrophota bacterium]
MDGDLEEIISAVKFYIDLEKESGMAEFFSKDESLLATKPVKEDLETLKKEVLKCEACELSRTRRNVVFGSGNPHAALMFIGEAPGEDEDIQGLPFVGRAGQLLTRIIEAMGMKRSDVYIANILKCRPPNNRSPLPSEILACRENVKRQIEIIRPKVICALGKFASQTLLNADKPISALRGKFYEYEGIKVMPTFHPAYLLRNPQDKKLVWEDMKKIKKELDKN